ncbi:methyltransferase domain-containing protein [Amycolatopsis sp. NPDC058986]|uniref:methyltransferase domain-containing protein n=1 Tax=unclassified Amycolatopsis TaxID=2618356 RepID=UPI00366C4C60
MPEHRVAQALARLGEHQQLHLPLKRTDLLGRLALRFLWRRQLKWQIESNLAIHDALAGLDEAGRVQRARVDQLEGADRVSHEELAHEVELLKRSDQNLMAGLNQRLFSSLGRIESQLGDLRLRLAETAEHGEDAEQRIKALEAQIATLTGAARDVRLRHAQLDGFLDQVRANRPETAPTTDVAERDSFLELALSELLDGPADHVRAERGRYVPAVRKAHENGANGPVFDVAPARGEWLEVLRAENLPYRAASANSLVRRHIEGLGLRIEDADALETLATAPARSLGAVTAFRYAERLEPSALARFVDAAATALQPGGALIVETPAADDNASGDFRIDPYARKPLHPVFLRFLAESAGLTDVEIVGAGDRYSLIAWR